MYRSAANDRVARMACAASSSVTGLETGATDEANETETVATNSEGNTVDGGGGKSLTGTDTACDMFGGRISN